MLMRRGESEDLHRHNGKDDSVEPYLCAICAERAHRRRQRILNGGTFAEGLLTLLRKRLKQEPPTARILSDPHLREGMIQCSLTVRQLNILLAQGTAFSALPAEEKDSYWLVVRHPFSQKLHDQTLLRHYHLVIWSTFPPTPIERVWEFRAYTLYEAEPPRYDEEGFQRCWCQRKEYDDAL